MHVGTPAECGVQGDAGLCPYAVRGLGQVLISLRASLLASRAAAGAPWYSRDGTVEAAGCQGACVAKGIEKADGMVCGHVVVEALRAYEHCVAVRAVARAHAGTKLRESKAASFCSGQCYSLPKHCVFTQSGAAPDCQKPTLLRRCGFWQQVSASVRPQVALEWKRAMPRLKQQWSVAK